MRVGPHLKYLPLPKSLTSELAHPPLSQPLFALALMYLILMSSFASDEVWSQLSLFNFSIACEPS